MFAPKYRRKVFFEEKRLEIRKILRKLCKWKGEVFVEAFDDGEEQLPFVGIGNVFHCGDKFHAVVRQLLAVDDGFILVAGESVELINCNIFLWTGSVWQSCS